MCDVRVVQRRERLGFPREPDQSVRISRKEIGQHFEGDVTIELAIPGPLHLAHPAGPEGREDFVRAEAGADGQGQMLGSGACWDYTGQGSINTIGRQP